VTRLQRALDGVPWFVANLVWWATLAFALFWCAAQLSKLETWLVSDNALAMQRVASYREPPHGAKRFVSEQFHVTPDPWQEEVLEAWLVPGPGELGSIDTFQRVGRISLQAAAGVGKSAVMAWCAWHFIACMCLDEYAPPKGLVTGITNDNVRDNFWAEMARWQAVSPWLTFAFRHTDKRIFAEENPAQWFLGRRNWPKSGTADEQGATLSGLHGPSVAAFVDESGNIPPTVGRAGEQMLSELGVRFGRLMQAGNPISLAGMLHEAANKLRAFWRIIRVTNDPDDPRRSPRGDVEWARQQIAAYGRENPWVKSYILGLFPPASINSLLGHEDVMAAMDRKLTPDMYQHAQKRIGIDVARFGDDRTVLFPRQGPAVFRPVVMRNARTTEIAARVYTSKAKFGSELELIDASNYLAAGVVDNLLAAGVPVHEIAFSGKAQDPRFKNRRVEMWFRMAEHIKRVAALPSSVAELVEELTAPTYMFHNGVFQLEEKDQIKKRIGKSPDLADGLACTYALPDMPAGVLQQLADLRGGNKVATDYDPMRSL
jgi:phage terminase large subunit